MSHSIMKLSYPEIPKLLSRLRLKVGLRFQKSALKQERFCSSLELQECTSMLSYSGNFSKKLRIIEQLPFTITSLRCNVKDDKVVVRAG